MLAEMTALTPVGTLTMSSREIAELAAKRHDNVMRDIRQMIVAMPETGLLKIEEIKIKDLTGESTSHFNLPKRETIILVSGYDVGMRARIVDRWMELEAKLAEPRLPDLSDPAVLLTLLTEHTSKRIEAERRADTAERVAETVQGTLKRLGSADGSLCITDAAKTLGVRPKDLFARLSAERWTFKRVGNHSWLAYQSVIQAGFMEHDDHIFVDEQGRERVNTRALVTAKGLVRLAEILNKPLH